MGTLLQEPCTEYPPKEQIELFQADGDLDRIGDPSAKGVDDVEKILKRPDEIAFDRCDHIDRGGE
jgi:hypothetical protein